MLFTQFFYNNQSGAAPVANSNKLFIWGNSASGQLGYFPPTLSIAQVSAGTSHIVVIRSDGLLFTWGQNTAGQLGDGTTLNKSSPVQIGTGSWTQVTAGASHTVAIDTRGLLWSWGLNSSGQLGLGITTNRTVPILVGTTAPIDSSTNAFTVTSVNGGAMTAFSPFATGDYNITTYGGSANFSGVDYLSVPSNAAFIFGTNDFTIEGWIYFTALSAATIFDNRTSPTSLHPVLYCSAGANLAYYVAGTNVITGPTLAANQWYHIALVRASASSKLYVNGVHTGTTYADTNNFSTSGVVYMGASAGPTNPLTGYLSNIRVVNGLAVYTTSFTPSAQPLTATQSANVNGSPSAAIASGTQLLTIQGIGSPSSWTQVNASTGNFTLAVRNNSTLWVWGLNSVGQLGDGTTANKSSPIQIAAGSWSQISAGGSHSAATRSDNLLFTWGLNSAGQLGLGTTTNKLAPIIVGASAPADTSTNAFAITLNGGPAMTAFSPFASGNYNIATFGGGCYFNGTTDFLSLAGNVAFAITTSTTPFTIEAWAYSYSAGGLIFSEGFTGAGNTIGIVAGFATSNSMDTPGGLFPAFGWYNGSAWTTAAASSTQIALNTWNHIAFVFTGSTSRIYLNGVDVTRASLPTPATTWGVTGVNGDAWYIGRRWDLTSVGQYYNGIISNFRFVKSTAVYTTAFTPATAPLTATQSADVNGSPSAAIASGTSLLTLQSLGTPTSWTQVSAGISHTLAIRSDSAAFAWGQNNAGQMGDGTTLNKSSPVQISVGTSWSAVNAGTSYSMGIQQNNLLFAWGLNSTGQLGHGSTVNKIFPSIGGTISDTSSNNFAIVQTGNPYFTILSPFATPNTNGYSMYFPGTGNYLAPTANAIFNPGATGEWTIECFVYPLANGNFYGVGGGTAFSNAIGCSWTNSTFTFSQGNGSSNPVSITTPANYPINAWYHYTVVKNSSNLITMYVNGIQVGTPVTYTLSISGGTQAVINGLNDNNGLGNSGFTGAVSNLRWIRGTAVYSGTNTVSANFVVPTGSFSASMSANPYGGSNTAAATANFLFTQLNTTASTWTKVSAGTGFSAAADSTNTLYAWGSNALGVLGNSSTISRSSPVVVSTDVPNQSSPVQIGTSSWSQVSMGASHGTAISSSNLLYAWGFNTSGQVGDFTTIAKSSPVQIGASSWSQVTAGEGDYSIAIRSDSTLWAWGNTVTTLGQIPAQLSWRQIAESGNYGVGIKGDGTLWSWGINSAYQLGDGTSINKSSPVQISATTNWTSLNNGQADQTFAINSAGALYGWGNNLYGQFGDSNTTSRSVPTQIFADKSWISVAGAATGITTDGSLWSWGYNVAGQVGDGTTINQSSPVQILAGTSFTSVTGYFSKYATTTTGKLYVWGLNAQGQLGDNTTINKSSPTQLYSPSGSGFSPATVIFSSISPAIDGKTSWTIADGNIGLYAAGTYTVTVATNVTMQTKVWGAGGGTVTLAANYTGGAGGAAQGFVNYLSGTSYNLIIGQGGTGGVSTGRNAAGGAGGTGIEIAGASTPVIVGGGGGGAPSSFTVGNGAAGAGGGTAGQDGDGISGKGGTQSAAGAGGIGIRRTGSPGSGRNGGNGQGRNGVAFAGGTGFGTGGGGMLDTTDSGSGGGGGGYFGGGGGGGDAGGSAGGGGSGYLNPSYVDSGALTAGVYGVPGNSTDANRSTAGTAGTTGAGNTTTAATGSDGGIYLDIVSATNGLDYSTFSWVAVGAGLSHVAAIRNNLTLWIWGGNSLGQLGDGTTLNKVVPLKIGVNSWQQISSGSSHTVGVTTSGFPFAWGGNSSGQLGDGTTINKSTPAAIGAQPFNKLVATATATTGIKDSGAIFLWGLNSSGQLGDNTTINKLSPVQLGTLPATISSPVQIGSTSNNTSITAGQSTASVIDSTGGLYTWGINSLGQLGDGTTLSRTDPFKIGASSWSQISMGPSHTMAVRSDGVLFVWGSNISSRLGDDTTINKSSPIQLGTSSWSHVSAGTDHSMAIRDNGTLWAWGSNSTGQLGIITQPFSWVQIATGISHTVALRADNTLWTWGGNNVGQLGDETAVTKSSPVQIGANSSWTSIFAGSNHSGAIRSDGILFTWGINTGNQLGDGTAINKSSPVQIGTTSWLQVRGGQTHTLGIDSVSNLYGWGASGGLYASTPAYPWLVVSEGAAHTSAIRNDGMLFTWGLNASGQLGDGTSLNRSSPTQIGYLSWAAVSSGGSHTLAITSDGLLFAWGLNSSFQVGDSSTINKSIPVQIGTSSWSQVNAGTNHSMGLTINNMLFTWGNGGSGQQGQLTAISSWTQVNAGNNTSAGITPNGQLYTWGLGTSGQLGDSSIISKSSPVLISSGTSWNLVSTNNTHSLAIQSDNSAWAFGQNNLGQLGDGTTINRLLSVEIGGGFTVIDSSSVPHTMTKSGTSYTTSIVPFSGTVSGIFSYSTSNVVQTISTDYVLSAGFTLECWFYITEYIAASQVISQLLSGSDGTNSWFISNLRGGYDSSLVFSSNIASENGGTNVGAYGNTVNTGINVPVNTWNHCAVVRIGGVYNIYLNGVLKGTVTYTGVALTTGSTTVTIGSSYTGLVSQVRIVKGVAVYTGNFTPPTLAPLATSGSASASAYPSTTNVNTTFSASSTPLLLYTTLAASISGGILYYNKISAGVSFSSGINSVGALFTWGLNSSGQLGDGTTINKSLPVQIGTSSWSQVNSGQVNSTAIDTLGRLYTWGSGQFGQLGDGTTTNKSSPVQIGSSSWSQISNGLSHTLAITSDGKLFAWGVGANGVLGNGLTTNRSAPVAIGTSSWLQVSAGNIHSMAIRSDNTLWGWGSAASGQIGNIPLLNTSSPVQVGTSSWTQVSAGTSYTLAIDTNGIQYAWGDDVNGKLGI